MEHADRIAQEISFFKDMDLNALPAIYSYWSNKYLTELLNEAYGSFDLFGVFARELGESVRTTGNPTIVSIGSGDAEVECAIAARMLDLGYTDFCFECLELSTFLIDRARERVAGTRLEAHLRFVEIDLTQWAPAAPFGACFANHSLHHIVALEHCSTRFGRTSRRAARRWASGRARGSCRSPDQAGCRRNRARMAARGKF